eukprot:4368873-Amphidinium_carterae.1
MSSFFCVRLGSSGCDESWLASVPPSSQKPPLWCRRNIITLTTGIPSVMGGKGESKHVAGFQAKSNLVLAWFSKGIPKSLGAFEVVLARAPV